MNTNIVPIDVIGDPTRRKILECLRREPCSVNELAKRVGVSQPAVSQHLRVLRQARLVQVRQLRQQHIYAIDPLGFRELRAYIDSFWEPVLAAFQENADNIAKQERNNE